MFCSPLNILMAGHYYSFTRESDAAINQVRFNSAQFCRCFTISICSLAEKLFIPKPRHFISICYIFQCLTCLSRALLGSFKMIRKYFHSTFNGFHRFNLRFQTRLSKKFNEYQKNIKAIFLIYFCIEGNNTCNYSCRRNSYFKNY